MNGCICEDVSVRMSYLMNKRFVRSELQMREQDLDPEQARGDGEEEQGDKQVFVNTDPCYLKGSKCQNIWTECFK